MFNRSFRWIVVALTAMSVIGCNTPLANVPQSTQVPSAPVKVAAPDTSKLLSGSKNFGNNTLWLVSAPNPPVRGNNIFEAVMADATGNSINDAKVTFDLNMTNMNMGRNAALATFQGAGRYSGTVFFSMGGPWRVNVLVQRSGQPDATVQFNFSISR